MLETSIFSFSHSVFYHFKNLSFKPFPKLQVFDSSKLKEFAVDNFRLDENDRKFSKWEENTVGKGEIARNDSVCSNLHHSPSQVLRNLLRNIFENVFVALLQEKMLITSLSCLLLLTLSQTSPGFTCLRYNSFESTVGKGEIARNEQFLLFPQCFKPFGELSAIFIESEIVVCRCFQFGRV